MGVHGQSNNTKRSVLQKKPHKLHRVKRAERKKQHGFMAGEIVDKELTTVHHLKKRRTSPRANITLSGKKRRKLIKQLKHQQAEQNKMEVESTKETKKKGKKNKDAAATKDTMEEDVPMQE